MENVQAARGRGNRRIRGRGRERGRVAAEAPMRDAPQAIPVPEQQGVEYAQGPAPVPQPVAQTDLAALVNTLMHRIKAQDAEICKLRNQQLPPAQVPMYAASQADPQVVPPMGQVNVAADLFERFRRMRASPEFEGSTDPLVVDEWMSEIKTIFNFMDITEEEKVICASFVLKKDARYWWETVATRRDVRAMTWV